MCVYNVHVSSSCPLREPKSSSTPTVMSTPSAQIVVSKYDFPLRGSRASWRKTDSWAKAEMSHDEPEIFCYARKKGNIQRTIQRSQKGHRS